MFGGVWLQLTLRVEQDNRTPAEHIEPATPRSRVERSAVWFTGQVARTDQRDNNRYLQDSYSHPGKMLPHVAQSILNTYGETGDVWLDPMCGIGTTLVEAMTFGYTVYGVEWEQRWVDVCRTNIEKVLQCGYHGRAIVQQGDARNLSAILGDTKIDKIAFSPPYGNTLSKTAHGPDKHPERQQGGKKAAKAIRHGYSFTGTEEAAIPDQPGDMTILADSNAVNLGDLKHGDIDLAVKVARELKKGLVPTIAKPTYLTEMAKVYNQCATVLKPGGLMLLVLRDYRRNKKRVDLLGDTLDLCEALGLEYHDRTVALQCPVEMEEEQPPQCQPDGHLGFWTIQNCKGKNPPIMIPVFEDILIVRKPSPKARRTK